MSNLFTEVSVEQQEIVAGGWYGKGKNGKNGYNLKNYIQPLSTKVAPQITTIVQAPVNLGSGFASAAALVVQNSSQFA